MILHGYKITAGFSKGGRGKLYGYYLCQRPGCSQKGKSMPKAKLENSFLQVLKSVTPANDTIKLTSVLLRAAWENKNDSVDVERRKLETEIRNIERQVDRYLELIVATRPPDIAATYENKIEGLQFNKATLKEQLGQIGVPARPFDEMFELSMQFLANPSKVWKKSDTAAQRRVLGLVFAQPLLFSRESGLRPPKTTFPFKCLEPNEKEGYCGATHSFTFSKKLSH